MDTNNRIAYSSKKVDDKHGHSPLKAIITNGGSIYGFMHGIFVHCFKHTCIMSLGVYGK